MHQLSNIQKINVKIDLEVHVADMTKNKLQNKTLGQDKLLSHYNMVV